MSTVRSPSRLLQYLPAIYQEEPFIGQLLLAFEKVILGLSDDVDYCYKGDTLVSTEDNPDICYRGLEKTIADLADLFDPKQTPEDFLLWLADWTAFSLRADLDKDKQRDFIANIIPLYRRRGTRQNLQELLKIFTIGTPTVTEGETGEFEIGVHSTIGEDTSLGGLSPHFFRVTVSLPRMAEEVWRRQMKIICSLIELEKPAHTFCDMPPEVAYPSMQIGDYSTIGVDTILGVVGSA